MLIEIVKSKIHRVTVTASNLDYIGSIGIDEDLIDAANLTEFEKVHVLDINNGTRLETYVMKEKRGSGEICINGPAARRISIGDIIIIISYASLDFEEAKKHKPVLIFPDTKTNRLKK
jgi:aspartate 1-decarboxylase